MREMVDAGPATRRRGRAPIALTALTVTGLMLAASGCTAPADRDGPARGDASAAVGPGPSVAPGTAAGSTPPGTGPRSGPRPAPDAGDAPTSTPPGPSTTAAAPPTGAFDAADRALQQRVRSAGLGGGLLLVGQRGETIHEHRVGSVTPTTPLSVASTAKWLTAATLMTFVDEGAASLDDDVARWLPEFAGSDPPTTLRQLLVHTSGVRDQPCLWNGTGLASCVRSVASGPRQFAAGSAFSYGNADFHVIGRVIEELGGSDFAAVVRERITGPLAMDDTSWPGAPTSPSPAAGARTTAADYSRFLRLLLDRGVFDGRRLLSEDAVTELTRDQVAAHDTTGDYAVGITKIPRYALGAWPDVVDEGGRSVVVSGNGGRGYYPWIDYATGSYGIVAVQDDRGAQLAVPASQAVAVLARDAFRR